MSKLQIFLSNHQKEFASERKALKDYLEGDALLIEMIKTQIPHAKDQAYRKTETGNI